MVLRDSRRVDSEQQARDGIIAGYIDNYLAMLLDDKLDEYTLTVQMRHELALQFASDVFNQSMIGGLQIKLAKAAGVSMPPEFGNGN